MNPTAELPAHLVPASPASLGGPDRTWLLGEANRLLDDARASRAEEGGFGWLDGDGRRVPARGRPLWITTRMTHCFALGHLLGREGDGELADHGVAALNDTGPGGHRDGTYGGWFTDPDQPDEPKGAYGHAHVILAASSAAAAGRPGGRELLADALAVSEQRFWDDEAGAVVEEWDRSFSTLDPYRGANANMHTTEAYLAAADATGDRIWRDRALRIATRIIDTGARARDWRVPEHFAADWTEQPDYNRDAPAHPFRPYGATPGHGMEWARLLLHLEASLAADGLLQAGPGGAHAWLREAAVGLFDRALADGWDEQHGGICYTTDWDGTPVVEQHFHWVTCEAIATAAVLHRVTGEERFAQWYRRLWEYAQSHFIDGRPGWQMEVDPDGAPSAVTWDGRPDTYHALQLCLIPLLPLSPAFSSALAG